MRSGSTFTVLYVDIIRLYYLSTAIRCKSKPSYAKEPDFRPGSLPLLFTFSTRIGATTGIQTHLSLLVFLIRYPGNLSWDSYPLSISVRSIAPNAQVIPPFLIPTHMYLVKTPTIIQKMFPNFHWKVATEEPVIYLTFDDGPIPEVTPWVLEQLQQYDARATFFCVGANVERHPNLLRQVLAAGHTVGNHTMTHKDGWLTENLPYFHDIRHAGKLVDSSLFRPPYGRLKPAQAQFLQRHYDVVMWDVLSGDFDPHLMPTDCVQNVVRHAKPGSIVVFHDSLKARENLEYALPRVLKHFTERGYRFGALTADLLHQTKPLPAPALRTA